MENKEIRYINFMALLNDFRDRHPEIGERGYIKEFCIQFNMKSDYVSHMKNGYKPIGDEKAREIERKCGKTTGWLDIPHDKHLGIDEGEQMAIDMVRKIWRSGSDAVRRDVSEFLMSRIQAR